MVPHEWEKFLLMPLRYITLFFLISNTIFTWTILFFWLVFFPRTISYWLFKSLSYSDIVDIKFLFFGVQHMIFLIFLKQLKV
jgi:hypothetical protein